MKTGENLALQTFSGFFYLFKFTAMCYHTSQTKDIEEIKKAFQLPEINGQLFQQAFQLNGFEKPFLPVISSKDNSHIDFFRWMLIPSYVKSEEDWKANTLNARAEGLFETPAYKNFWHQRCLVICTGFFEPHYPPNTKKPQTYYIQPKNQPFFTLAGIFSKWQDINTFSIIMVNASKVMAEIHNDKKRMPLILDGENRQKWLEQDLDKEEMKSLMKTPDLDEHLQTYRVMDGVFNSRRDTNVPDVIQPFKSDQAEQGSLF